jgi:hypothetical protein
MNPCDVCGYDVSATIHRRTLPNPYGGKDPLRYSGIALLQGDSTTFLFCSRCFNGLLETMKESEE